VLKEVLHLPVGSGPIRWDISRVGIALDFFDDSGLVLARRIQNIQVLLAWSFSGLGSSGETCPDVQTTDVVV
jgi:hypothetical protein